MCYLTKFKIYILCFLLGILFYTVSLTKTQAQELESPESSGTFQVPQKAIEKLNPEQQEIIKQEFQKGGLTPEGLKELLSRPEFQGLSPEEVIRAKKEWEKHKEEKHKGSKVTTEVQRPVPKGKVASLFEEYYRLSQAKLEVPTRLSPFGYNLFRRGISKPIPAQPVAPDYIIGPGDEIEILLWGRLNAKYSLVVRHDGQILVPRIGPLNVAGMRYDEMKKFLMEQINRIQGTEVAITLGKLRQIQVFVLGEVRNPGPYNLPAMCTMVDALIAAGGPTGRGSLRKILLKRGNNIVSELDLYDLLINGDKSKDKRLRHGDIAFVPLVGPLVGVAGNVRRPAIYELKTEKTLFQVLKLAGWLLPTAWEQKVQVERPERHKQKIVLDIKASEVEKLKAFTLKDGDLVKVFSILPDVVNAVKLIGHVVRPGTYAYHPGMKLSEVLKSPKDLLPETYLDYALIKRKIFPSGETKLIPFSIKEVVIDKTSNVELAPSDKIYVFSKWYFQDRPVVTVEGEVRKPGKIVFSEKNFRIKDAILKAGGLTRNAYLKKAELYRIDKQTKETKLIIFNLEKALLGDPKHNQKLQDLDRLVIHSILEFRPKQVVSIEGAVNKPGTYPYVKNMRVCDLIFAAGNLKESAYLKEAELTSYEVKNGKLCEVSRRTINLEKALSGDPKHNVILEPYDRLFVRTISRWQKVEYVTISGEVLFPGKYIITPGERLSSIIKRAGGFTKDAYLKGAVFTRKKVKELQQQRLNEMIERLEMELLGGGAAGIAGAISSEEAKIKGEEVKLRQKFLARLKRVKAKGRIVIHLDLPERLQGTEYDIPLEDGDSLFIPTKPSTIQVVGAVYNQSAFLFEKGKGVGYYIKLAGGFTPNADKKHIYILKVDGSTKRPPKHLRFLRRTKLDPGDTIVVPEKLEKIPWLRNIKDVSTILYQVAVSTGVVMNVW